MKKTRKFAIILIAMALVLCATSAFASPVPLRLYPTGEGDGYAGRSWYGWYGSWADTGGTNVSFWHNGENRESGRGMVIVNISSLAGKTLSPNSASFNFYSYGINGTSLQFYGGDPGSAVAAGFSQAGGSEIAFLNGVGEGWQRHDVTSYLQSGIDAGWNNVGLIFNVVWNMNGGNVGAVEGPAGSTSYIEVVPEPSSLLALVSGITGLAGFVLRRRNG